MTALEPYMVYIRIGVYVLLTALCFGGGWEINGWRLKSEVEGLKAQYATASAKGLSTTLATQQSRDAANAAQARELASMSQKAQDQQRKDADETNRLRTCVANHTCGLRIEPGLCPGPASNVSGTSSVGSMDIATRTEPDAAAVEDIFNLRTGIERVQSKLAACQQAAAKLTGQ